jgi:hypothetical protein
MSRRHRFGKDHLGGALLVLMGGATVVLGVGYRMGTLNRMGPGYIPVVLGVLMVLVGVAIALTAAPSAPVAPPSSLPLPLPTHGHATTGPQWRGWLCILGGVMAFVLLGERAGLAPATFASVFIACMGDRLNTVKSSAALAAVMTVFSAIVFYYGLHLQLPLVNGL